MASRFLEENELHAKVRGWEIYRSVFKLKLLCFVMPLILFSRVPSTLSCLFVFISDIQNFQIQQLVKISHDLHLDQSLELAVRTWKWNNITPRYFPSMARFILSLCLWPRFHMIYIVLLAESLTNDSALSCIVQVQILVYKYFISCHTNRSRQILRFL